MLRGAGTKYWGPAVWSWPGATESDPLLCYVRSCTCLGPVCMPPSEVSQICFSLSGLAALQGRRFPSSSLTLSSSISQNGEAPGLPTHLPGWVEPQAAEGKRGGSLSQWAGRQPAWLRSLRLAGCPLAHPVTHSLTHLSTLSSFPW